MSTVNAVTRPISPRRRRRRLRPQGRYALPDLALIPSRNEIAVLSESALTLTGAPADLGVRQPAHPRGAWTTGPMLEQSAVYRLSRGPASNSSKADSFRADVALSKLHRLCSLHCAIACDR